MQKFTVLLTFLLSSFWTTCPQAVFFYKPNACEKAISLIEEEYNVPRGLLLSIAIVESAKNNTKTPWSWAVGTVKRSYYPPSKLKAIFLVKKLQYETKNIDVGCMQINLKAHPKAFKSLEEAFDPIKNVKYAALFIKALKTKNNTWKDVVGLYHSRKKEYHEPYKERVYLTWFSLLKEKGQNILAKVGQKIYKSKEVFKGTKRLPQKLMRIGNG